MKENKNAKYKNDGNLSGAVRNNAEFDKMGAERI
jgi:hypothetical protein